MDDWRCNCATELPARETYEGVIGGWPDGRLGQAYDLIDAIMREQNPQNEGYAMLKQARGLVSAYGITSSTSTAPSPPPPRRHPLI